MFKNFTITSDAGTAVGIDVDARNFKKGKTIKDYLRIKPEEWDAHVAKIQAWLKDADANEKVELRITTHESVQNMKLEDVKDQICW